VTDSVEKAGISESNSCEGLTGLVADHFARVRIVIDDQDATPEQFGVESKAPSGMLTLAKTSSE
jgi:hypothetical protein